MLSLQYHRSNSFLFVNGIKICQFKAKNSEMKHIGTISKDFTVKKLKKKKKKTRSNGYVYNNFDINNIIVIHKHWIK